MQNGEMAAVGRVLLLGCGKMGGAMLSGWLEAGLSPAAATVIDPAETPEIGRFAARGVAVNPKAPDRPDVAVIAVKPQTMAAAAPALAAYGGGGTLFVSIAAGTPLAAFEAMFGATSPIVRAMPNTPSAIGRGITAYLGNAAATEGHLEMAERLLSAVGATVRLSDEAEMDAVTGVSGSGPAYVFHMIEALAEAGVAAGLDPNLAMRLARATVTGAGALAEASPDAASTLRQNVTSPGGTTAAGLGVLMPELGDLMIRTVAAAAARSRELSEG